MHDESAAAPSDLDPEDPWTKVENSDTNELRMVLDHVPVTGVNSLEPAQVRPRTTSHNQAPANLQDIL